MYSQQSKNIHKTWIIMGLFLVLVIALGWLAAQYFGNAYVLYGAVLFAFVMNAGSFWFSDKIALSASGAKEADEKKFLELHRIVANLAITAGLPKPRVYIIADAAPNAFATGRDAQHAAVAVTTGLLQTLERNELEGVIAHELSHIGNRDILVMSVVVVLVGFIAVISDIAWRVSFYGGGDRDRNVHPAVFIVGIFALIFAPIVAQLMQLAISRKREFLADATGSLLTRYPEGLASALEKISAHHAPMQKTSGATAHLFIANPFGTEKGSVASRMARLFATHPPVQERIKILREMGV